LLVVKFSRGRDNDITPPAAGRLLIKADELLNLINAVYETEQHLDFTPYSFLIARSSLLSFR
jgi:hypothetical protein